MVVPLNGIALSRILPGHVAMDWVIGGAGGHVTSKLPICRSRFFVVSVRSIFGRLPDSALLRRRAVRRRLAVRGFRPARRAVATLTAVLLGVATDRVTAGLEGFNGTLIGVALVLYFDVRWVTVLLVIVGSIMGSVLTSALAALLTPHQLPTFTAPFCAITTVMLIGGPAFERVWRGRSLAAPPSAAYPGREVTFTDLWQGLFNGIGQVFFQSKWYVGLIFLIGLLFGGWLVGVTALSPAPSAWWWHCCWARPPPTSARGCRLRRGADRIGLWHVPRPDPAGRPVRARATGGVDDHADGVASANSSSPSAALADLALRRSPWIFLAAVPAFSGLRRSTT